MVVKCILIFTMIVWKFIRREACQTVPLFRTEIRLQFHQREEPQFWQIYLIGWDIWNVKVVDTYCSSMAKSGMNPKTLQYLMGHSDIGVTLNTYTHLGAEDAKEELGKYAKMA